MNDAIVAEEVADKIAEGEEVEQKNNSTTIFEWTHCNECTHHRTYIKKV